MGALGCTQRTRGRRRVGSALEWQRGEKTRERARERRESDESDNAVEGSEEYFDESEHVGDLAEEERSTDGEDGFGEEVDETRENQRQGCRSSEGSDFEDESEGEDGRGPEGSDFAAEESYEEGDPDAEEGYEEVWDEVQEALSAMEHEEFDDTAEADFCARSQASRPSSAASSQASVQSCF